jgi:hypothetical protein
LAWPGAAAAEAAVAALRERIADSGVEVVPALLPQSFGTYRAYLQLVADPEVRLAELLGPPGPDRPRAPRARPHASRTRRQVVDVTPPTPTPATPTLAVATDSAPVDRDEIVLRFDDRRWRVRGVAANRARGTLRVNVLATREGAGMHMDVLDMCSARHRAALRPHRGARAVCRRAARAS